MSEGRTSVRFGLLAVGLAICAIWAPQASAAPLGSSFDFDAAFGVAGITAGPDGNLWYVTPFGADQVSRITPDGATTTFTAGNDSRRITTGADGNLWFSEFGSDAIGRITPGGTVTQFSTGVSPSSLPFGITTGPDGNVWFTEYGGNRIGQITPTGTVTEFSSGLTPGSQPFGITSGLDGNLWFTESAANRIGKIDPDGSITEFSTGISPNAGLASITAGPDGNVWFTEDNTDRIGRITPTGKVTEFSSGISANTDPFGIAVGADGNLWFGEQGDRIGRITPGGTVTEFPISGTPSDIAAGPDGNLWATESATSSVARIGVGAHAASLDAPSVTGAGEPGTRQVCQGARWASFAGEQPQVDAFAYDGYRWLRDGSVIAGQTTRNYTLGAGDVGHAISCRITVTYPLTKVTAIATSDPTTVVAKDTGPQGAPGQSITGPAGPAGRTGADGAPGKVLIVTCTTKRKTKKVHGKKKKVTVKSCSTRSVSGTTKFTTASASAVLSRGGRLYARGSVNRGRLTLRSRRALPAGRYRLALTSHHHTTRQTIMMH